MHPILFILGGVPVYAYGTLMALAAGGCLLLLTYLAVRERVSIGHVLIAYLGAVVIGLVGARLAYFVVNLDELGSIAAAFDMKRGGLVGYGGFLGALAGAYLFLRRGPVRVLVALDLAAPCFFAWIATLRVGCYFFGCDFGVPLPEGAPRWLKQLGTFPHWAYGTIAGGEGAPAWAQHVREGLIPRTASASLPVHPTQLYDVLLGALLFWATFALRPYQRFRGQISSPSSRSTARAASRSKSCATSRVASARPSPSTGSSPPASRSSGSRTRSGSRPWWRTLRCGAPRRGSRSCRRWWRSRRSGRGPSRTRRP